MGEEELELGYLISSFPLVVRASTFDDSQQHGWQKGQVHCANAVSLAVSTRFQLDGAFEFFLA